MPKFNVTAPVVGSRFIGTYEAETAEDAILQAEADRSAGYVGLCHQCASQIEDPEVDWNLAEAYLDQP